MICKVIEPSLSLQNCKSRHTKHRIVSANKFPADSNGSSLCSHSRIPSSEAENRQSLRSKRKLPHPKFRQPHEARLGAQQFIDSHGYSCEMVTIPPTTPSPLGRQSQAWRERGGDCRQHRVPKTLLSLVASSSPALNCAQMYEQGRAPGGD